MTKKLKQSNYTNENPPFMDKKWSYDSHTDLLKRFKAMGFKLPSERTKK